jgi:hypothetical protein
LTLLVATGAEAAFRDEVLADMPRVYYEFEETSGTTADNSASAAAIFNGTYVSVFEDLSAAPDGYTLGVPAAVGRGVELTPGFDAVADMPFGGAIDVPNLVLTDGSYTIEMVLKFAEFDPEGDVDGFQGLYLTDHYSEGTTTAGPIHMNVGREDNFTDFDGGDVVFWESEGVEFSRDHFFHLVYVVDTSAADPLAASNLYANGVPVEDAFPNNGALPFPESAAAGGTSQFGGVLGPPAAPGSTVGAWQNPFDNIYERFLGAIVDEFAIYNTPLSEERVLAHFRATGLPAVPEPSCGALLALGIFSLLGRVKQFRTKT